LTILIASPISPDAVAQLKAKFNVVEAISAPEPVFRERFRDADALVFRSGVTLNAATLDAAPKLSLIVRAGSGIDNIDLDFVKRKGIAFHRIPEPGARAVAELSFALMLSLARNIREADRQWRAGHWAKYELKGYNLRGKTLGILGAGNIGTQVGRLGVAWGMEAIGAVEARDPVLDGQLRENGIEPVDFPDLIRRSDFLSIHLPLTDSTRHIINASVLRSMKKGSYVINLARGGVVDETALLEALQAGTGIAGAALDVHVVEKEGHISPLAALPNVILTPHIGAQTIDSQREIGERVVQIVTEHSKTRTSKGN
jgi:D-3-phosphoglycerate dehydrogenase